MRMNTMALVALALLACDDVGTRGMVGSFAADAGADSWALDGAWLGGEDDTPPAPPGVTRPDTPPPDGVCYDGPAAGEIAWCTTPEAMGEALPWRCAPRRMAECCAVKTADGCESYHCRDSETGCWVPIFTHSNPAGGPGQAACCPHGHETSLCSGATAWSDWWASYCDE